MAFTKYNNYSYPMDLSYERHQVEKCPTEIIGERIIARSTGLTSDEYLTAAWEPAAKHYMKYVVLRIKQIETKEVHTADRRSTKVTNIKATNDAACQLAITGRENYAEQLAALEIGRVRDIEYIDLFYDNTIGLSLLQSASESTG